MTDANGTASGDVDGRWSTLTARDGGTIAAPLLVSLQGVDVLLDGTGTLDTAQWQSFTSGRLTVDAEGTNLAALEDATGTQLVVTHAHAAFPMLTTLRFGSVSLANGGTVDLPLVSDIDGASFFVSGGVTLALPSVSSYSHQSTGSFQVRTWRVEDVGSRLDLSQLTTITNGTHYATRLSVEALYGGTIDLSGVISIIDPSSGDTRRRSVDVLADGAGSTIRLDALTTMTDANGTASGDVDGRWSTLTARDGGTIAAPLLVSLQGVDVLLDGTGTLDTAQWQSFTSGRLTIDAEGTNLAALEDATGTQLVVTHAHAAFPMLTTLRFGSVSLANGGTVALPLVSDIDGASFFVSGGVTLALPSASSYSHQSTGQLPGPHLARRGRGQPARPEPAYRHHQRHPLRHPSEH